MGEKAEAANLSMEMVWARWHDPLDEGIWVKGEENELEIYFAGRSIRKC